MPAARIPQVLRVAEDARWHVEAVETAAPGHATELARAAAAAAADVLLVNGGDGTINEAVNGLAGTATALAVLPGGTANVWAKEARIPRDPVKAMRAAVGGERRRIDLGRANGRCFLLMCGVGLDGEVVQRVNPRLKRRLGALAYLVAGLLPALRTPAWDVRLRLDGETVETPLYWMVIGNTRSYGGFRDVTLRALADDGMLDVALMRRGGLLHLVADGARLLVRRHDRSPNVRYLRARRIELETAFIAMQVDGEPFGDSPLIAEALPGALNVLVPRGLRSPLFGSPPGDG